MLDIKRIRQNPQELRDALKARNKDISIDEFLAQDEKRRTLMAQVEEKKALRNAESKKIGEIKKRGGSAEEVAGIMEEMRKVGDEIAAALSERGISVLHDRTLHDVPDYNDAYPHSLASVEDYMEKYPSLVFVLDVHRDAVSDADGNQYKLVSAEEPHAAQMSFIMGNAYDGWQENLKLAIAIQQNLSADYPTLMRPITMLNYRYNQFVSPGAMLLEVGAAGNSLDEALYAARLFAQGFADTLQS